MAPIVVANLRTLGNLELYLCELINGMFYFCINNTCALASSVIRKCYQKRWRTANVLHQDTASFTAADSRFACGVAS